jgi:ribosomal protein S12 methylthiotransferase
MESSRGISAARLRQKVGKRLAVMIDSATPRSASGRTKGDAPEIDGTVHVTSRRPLRVGDIVTVKIDRADAYDLHGSAV